MKEEIDLAGLAVYYWKRRFILAALTAVSTMAGMAYAFLATPKYESKAVIAPKEADDAGGGSSILSRLGSMGGVMASQLGIGRNGLERLELLLQSIDLAMIVIERHQLLPELFPEDWDAQKQTWKVRRFADRPSLRSGAKLLSEQIVKVDADAKKKMITVSAVVWDSTLASKIVSCYLEELNRKIKEDVRLEADSNVKYLEAQLYRSMDPTIREKITTLVAAQVEKATLMNFMGFDIIIKPLVPDMRTWPKRGTIVALSFVLGGLFAVSLVGASKALGEYRKRVG